MKTGSTWKTLDPINKDLLITKELVFDQCEFTCTKPIAQLDTDIDDFGAFSFNINKIPVIFRIAKVNPEKEGMVVNLSKKAVDEPIKPFDISDDFKFVIISSRNEDNLGLFIFPKSVLLNKGIIAGDQNEGKRTLKVYAPWEKTTSKQGAKNQQWQSEYFFEVPIANPASENRIKRMFTKKKLK
jgi:hypothetical protein